MREKKKRLTVAGFWNEHTAFIPVRAEKCTNKIYCLCGDVIPSGGWETAQGWGLAASQNGSGAPHAAMVYG